MPQSAYIILPLSVLSLIILAIIFGGHYFIYYSFIRFFKIAGIKTETALAIIFTTLSISFIIASIIAHFKQNELTRAFYFSSGLWLGIALNLLIFFAFAWLVFGASKLLDFKINTQLLAAIAIVFALLYSGYGVLNAYNLKIKNISVKIKNLPQEWQGKKIVQISDVHLGHVLDQKFLQKIADKINLENPEIAFITGDLFDGMDGHLDDLVRPVDNIKAPLGVYYITGNHETYLGVSQVYEVLKKTKIKILDDQTVNISGLQIIGISYPERSIFKNIREIIKKQANFNPKLPSILLYHDPTQVEEIKAEGINLQLAGHTHAGQVFPVNLVSRLLYGKYYHGLYQEEDYFIYTTSGAGVWGPTMRTYSYPEIVVITLE